jgi:1,4-alpha-glucan branching enzyme
MVNVVGNRAEFWFYRPQARRVELIGDFNRWRAGNLVMKQNAQGYWRAAIELPPGEYKFRYYADGEHFCDFAAFGVEYGPFGLDAVLRVLQTPASSRPDVPAGAARDAALPATAVTGAVENGVRP